MISVSALSSCKTESSCPVEKALKNILWMIVSFLCGRSTSGQAWPAEPSRHIQSPFFFRCGMRLSADLLTVLQTWTTGTAPVRHVFSRSAAAAAMLAGCGSKSPARRKSFCRSTSSRTGFILGGPRRSGSRVPPTLRIAACPQFYSRVRSSPRFSSRRAKALAPNPQSNALPNRNRSFVAASLPEKKSGQPDWPYLFPRDHEQLHDWSGKPRRRPQRSWPQKSSRAIRLERRQGQQEYRQNNLTRR